MVYIGTLLNWSFALRIISRKFIPIKQPLLCKIEHLFGDQLNSNRLLWEIKLQCLLQCLRLVDKAIKLEFIYLI